MFNLDFERFVSRLLPSALNGVVIRAFFCVLASPFKLVYENFMNFRNLKLWYLNYDCTKEKLEDMLNAYFHDLLASYGCEGLILIEDGTDGNEILLYQKAIQLPGIVSSMPVLITRNYTWGNRPFVVKVPEDVRSDINIDRLKRLVNIFKLYGISYTVTYYNVH